MGENKSSDTEIKADESQVKLEDGCVLSPNELLHYFNAADLAKVYLAERDNRIKAFVSKVTEDIKVSGKKNLRKGFTFTYSDEVKIKYRLDIAYVRDRIVKILKQLGYNSSFEEKDRAGREQTDENHEFTFKINIFELIQDEYITNQTETTQQE